jgi:hypothetical protein
MAKVENPQSVQIELLHPVASDGNVYGRGVHDVDAETAKRWLGFKDPISGTPIAQLPKAKEAPKGAVKEEKKKD